MIHSLLALLIATVVTIGVGYLIGHPSISVIGGIFPGIVAGIVFFVWRSRIVMKDLQDIMTDVQKLLTPKNTRRQPSPAEISKKIDRAVTIVKKGDKWRQWQPMVGAQLDGQIGTLYYMDARFKEAEPYLDKALSQNWVAKAMLGCIHYRQKNDDEMKKAFEAAVSGGKKDSLSWNTYAWCLWKRGDVDGAISVLNRAEKFVSSDERTKRNLNALSNGKGMKMQGWAEMWYQFRLERPQMAAMQRGGARMDRRSMYRGR